MGKERRRRPPTTACVELAPQNGGYARDVEDRVEETESMGRSVIGGGGQKNLNPVCAKNYGVRTINPSIKKRND